MCVGEDDRTGRKCVCVCVAERDRTEAGGWVDMVRDQVSDSYNRAAT